jgi:hypothetical protein
MKSTRYESQSRTNDGGSSKSKGKSRSVFDDKSGVERTTRKNEGSSSKSKKSQRYDNSEDDSFDDRRRDKKSSALVCGSSSKKTSGRRRDDDSDDKEVIQVERYQKYTYDQLLQNPNAVEAICEAFDCQPLTLAEYCRKGWIKRDNKNGLFHLDERMLELYEPHKRKRWELCQANVLEIMEEEKAMVSGSRANTVQDVFVTVPVVVVAPRRHPLCAEPFSVCRRFRGCEHCRYHYGP